MSKGINYQIVTGNIFTQAGHLIGAQNYKEKQSTDVYNNCDCLFVNHDNKTFWFSTQEHVKHTQQLVN